MMNAAEPKNSRANPQIASSGSASPVKRLLSLMVTPDQFDFWASQVGSKKAWQRCMARVVSIREEALDTTTLRLQPNGNFSGFTPGQHVNVSAVIRGKRVTRCYSLSNIPQADGWLEITVRRDPMGEMSTWLCDHVKKGTLLELENVFGDMTISQKDVPVLMLAAGSGITPIMSLLREQIASGSSAPVTLVYWEREAASFCFRDELEHLAHCYEHLLVHFVETGKSGRLSQQQLDALAVSSAGQNVFACGGADFVAQADTLISGSAATFVSEAFTRPAPVANDEAEKMVRVELLKSGRTLEVSNKANLLVALEEQGVAVKSGCRMGICNTCSCPRVSGETRDVQNNAAQKAGEPIRLCVSAANTNISLDV